MSEEIKASGSQEPQDNLLMDKEWMAIQTKAFTAWVNLHLKKKGRNIKDIFCDLRDGKNLAALLEVISNESLPRLEKGNYRVHHISNVNKCLNFVASKGVKLIGIAPEEIVDGNEKMTLGMIWTVILRWILMDFEGGINAKDGLLLWVQRRTKNYKDVKVTNFTSSWRSGRAFCALIDSKYPEYINYNELDNEDPRTRLEKAFSVAEKHLGIPRMVDPEDVMMDSPDEKSIFTYVAQYYHVLTSNQAAENALECVKNAISDFAEYCRLREEYEQLASDLLNWIKQSVDKMVDRTVEEDNFDCFNDKLKSYNTHVSDDKPKRAQEKHAIQCKLNTLQTKLRVNKRPEYAPPEYLNLTVINKNWAYMEEEERNRLEWINLNIRRFGSIDHLLKRYNYLCSNLETFISSCKDELIINDYQNELSPLLARQRKHDSFNSDVTFRMERLKNIDDIYRKLADLKYKKIDECSERRSSLEKGLKKLQEDCEATTATLARLVDTAKELEDARIEYFKVASAFKNECNLFLEDADDSHNAESVAEVKKLQDEHQNNIEMYTALKCKLNEVLECDAKIRKLSSSVNPYTSITGDQLKASYDKLIELSVTKTSTLDADLVKLEKVEEVMNQLRVLSTEVSEWYNKEKSRILAITGTLEEQQAELKQSRAKVDEYYEPKLLQLKTIVKQIEELQSNADRNLVSNIEDSFSELVELINSTENVIDNQLLIRDASILTEAQISEYHQLFKKLDKTSQNYLTHEDFRNFLVAIDMVQPIVDADDDKEFTAILNECDNTNSGQIFFPNILSYLAKTHDNNDKEDQLKQSFRTISDGKPYITLEKLRAEMPDLVDFCVQSMMPYTGPDAPPNALDYNTYSPDINASGDL